MSGFCTPTELWGVGGGLGKKEGGPGIRKMCRERHGLVIQLSNQSPWDEMTGKR